jgi:hypothetical protein
VTVVLTSPKADCQLEPLLLVPQASDKSTNMLQ